MTNLKFKSTDNIKIPKRIIDQVIGQESAVEVIKKAAEQRRHVLLIGEPGTGKSMLGMGLAELLPKEKLVDIIAFPNPNDENTPLIRTVAGGKGRDLVAKARLQTMGMFKNQNIFMFILVIIAMISPWWVRKYYNSDIMFAAFFLGGMMFLAAFVIFLNLGKRMPEKVRMPKIIVDNFKQKQAPFLDATGAHAGALLGDVLHDPFQTFVSKQWLQIKIDNSIITKDINDEIDLLMKKYHNNIIRNKNNYEAIYLPKNELFVLGETQGSISPVEVLSCNRYDYDGKMIKLTTSENKELIVTPEHKIAIWKNGEIEFIEAQKIKGGDAVVAKAEDTIIDEQDIINTYPKEQQDLARSYYNYLELRKQNPSWGYKRIATKLGVSYGRTRWWWDNNSAPVPVQTAERLKSKGLLPLRIDNPKLSLIAKVLGAIFGDGGIFENLNGIFLSSKEKHNIHEFRKDLELIFNLKQEENSRIIEGGEFGHSWCYQNTNRNIIRFFMALGSPIGKKSSQEFKLPRWIYINQELQKEFFGSLFGSEAGIPKVHISWTQLNTFDFGITGEKGLEENRMNFLQEIKAYLDSVGIKTGKISHRLVKTKYSNKGSILYRFLISTEFENLIRFVRNCKLNYCKYKREKLTNTVNDWKQEKRKRYYNLVGKGLGAEKAMSQLNLSQSALYDILNDKRFVAREYPIT